MIQPIDTDTIKQAVNLIDLIGNHVELHRESSSEYSGPCPWCGGTDRFHVRADYFCCREGDGHCGRKGDAIAFVQAFHNVDFKEACRMLSGASVLPTGGERAKPARKVQPAADDSRWNEAKERGRLLTSHNELMAGKTADARAAMAYLAGRGIEQATVAAFKIGYRRIHLPNTFDYTTKRESYPAQLAVALPWFDADGKLLAIKYRLAEPHTYTALSGKERTENKTSRGAQAGRMFGWQALQGSGHCRTLFIAEGELNALSIWQASGGSVDVLSAGSEGTTKYLPDDVVALAQRYARRIVWADRTEIADSAAVAIGADSVPSFKTEKHPKGIDANDLLQSGQLADFLKRLGIGGTVDAQPTATETKPPQLPPLPAEMWRTGFTTFAEARRYQKGITGYRTACGRGADGFYVAGPNSGLCAVHVPYTEQ